MNDKYILIYSEPGPEGDRCWMISGCGELISEGGDVVTRGMAGCARDVAMSFFPGEWRGTIAE